MSILVFFLSTARYLTVINVLTCQNLTAP